MNRLELRLPPAVLFLGTMAAMVVTARTTPCLDFDFLGRIATASVVAASGLGAAVAGIIAFRRQQTTLSPLAPGDASVLVVSGVYRWTRNPMYLGLGLALAGWGLVLGNLGALAWLPIAAVYLTRFQILPEERILAGRFGPDYAAYRAKVRRWI